MGGSTMEDKDKSDNDDILIVYDEKQKKKITNRAKTEDSSKTEVGSGGFDGFLIVEAFLMVEMTKFDPTEVKMAFSALSATRFTSESTRWLPSNPTKGSKCENGGSLCELGRKKGEDARIGVRGR